MSAEEDLVRRTLSETIALHERVRQANLQPVLDAAAAIAEAVRGSHVDQRKLADILQRAADEIRGLATPHDDTHGVDL